MGTRGQPRRDRRAIRNGARLVGTVAAAVVLLTIGCSNHDTPDSRRARGLALLDRSGAAVTQARSLSFTAHERGERVRRSGDKVDVELQHVVHVRRPDRLHVSVTGSYALELYYDGTQVTLVSPAEKVYGIVPASGDLDHVVHGVLDRYDLPFPLGDLVTYDTSSRLVDARTQGGWVGEETIGTRRVSKVAWQHPAVDWTVWIPEDGPPLPQRLEIVYKGRRGAPRCTFDIGNWRLGEDIPESTFVASVPATFEGIPVLQRASAVRSTLDSSRTSQRPAGAEPPTVRP